MLFYGYLLLGAILAFVAYAGWKGTDRGAKAGAGLVLTLFALPYLVVEVQTSRRPGLIAMAKGRVRSERFSPESHPSLTAKLLSVSRTKATVYVVRPGEFGDLIRLVRAKGRWTPSETSECVWSTRGSASGNVFPPYPWGD